MNSILMVRWLGLLVCLVVSTTSYGFYNPATGRWLSRDPIGEPGFAKSANGRFQPSGNTGLSSEVNHSKVTDSYRFTANCPVDLFDYLGLMVPRYWQIMWAAKYPGCACKANASQSVIFTETTARYGSLRDNTVVNAIIHCSWMCWVSSLKECGKAAAKDLGWAHEMDHPANPEHDRAMDFFNNEVGVNMGGNGLRDCFDRCYSAAWAHELYWYQRLDPQNWNLPSDFPDFRINSTGMATTPTEGGGSDKPPELLNR